MNDIPRNGVGSPTPYDYRRDRPKALSQRNRKIGMVAMWVALFLLVGSILYIAFLGGTNKGPMEPFHSSIPTTEQAAVA